MTERHVDHPTLDHGVGAGVWPALVRAAARTGEALAGQPGVGPDAHAFLTELRDAVRLSLTGEGFALASVDAPGSAVVVDLLRRHFGEELRSATPAEAFGAVHVFSALALAQCAVQDPAGPGLDDRHVALDLAVEVAHDMRSPLAAILFMVDMLRTGRSGAVSSVQQQQLGMVYAAALGLNQLACDLIDFVRGGDDIIDREPVPFSLASVLHDVHDIVRPAAEEKGVELRLMLPSERPRLGAPAAINRILLNLTSNAIRYSARGSVTIVAEELSEDRVRLSVQDSGSEIPPALVAQLFQPFRSASSGLRAFSGSGLGLAICHRLVTSLGSELRVSTAVGRGAVFSFDLDLPLAPEFGAPTRPAASVPPR